MKKIIFLILGILLCTACTKYEELNSLSIISNITIEKNENNYEIIMQEIIPTKKENGVNYTYKYRRSNAKELEWAFGNIINHSPKKIYLKKVQNIIISNQNKKEIITELKKYLKKNKNLNKETSIVIAKNNLHKVLKVNSDYMYIDSVLKNKKLLLKNLSNKKGRKIPILKIKNKELIFSKYYELQS